MQDGNVADPLSAGNPENEIDLDTFSKKSDEEIDKLTDNDSFFDNFGKDTSPFQEDKAELVEDEEEIAALSKKVDDSLKTVDENKLDKVKDDTEKKPDHAPEKDKAAKPEEAGNIVVMDDQLIDDYAKELAKDPAIGTYEDIKSKLDRFKGKPATETIKSFLHLEKKLGQPPKQAAEEVKLVNVDADTQVLINRAVLDEMKMLHPELEKDHPDMFKDMESFDEAMRDVDFDSKRISAKIINELDVVETKVKEQVEQVRDYQVNHAKYNQQAIGQALGTIGENLKRLKIDPKDLDVDLTADPKNKTLVKLVLDENARVKSSLSKVVAQDVDGEDINILKEDIIVKEFFFEHQEAIANILESKARADGYSHGVGHTPEASMTGGAVVGAIEPEKGAQGKKSIENMTDTELDKEIEAAEDAIFNFNE